MPGAARPPAATLLLVLVLGAAHAAAFAQAWSCRVEPFSGATSGQGAVATITVRNTGEACSIQNFGAPTEKKNPASSGRITQVPRHGTASFDAPLAHYVPAAGYIGADEFSYEARATGNTGQQVLLRVHVKVTVTAP
jgi:hypothetical protein